MKKTFKRHQLATAAAIVAALVPLAPAIAGSGFVEATAQDGTTFRLPTYFVYSPSGVRDTAVPEDAALATAEGRAVNFTGTALRKFIDPLPLPGAANAKPLADGSATKYIPVAVATKWTNPQGVVTNDDYYEVAVVEYTEKFHSDLKKATTLRGYVQIDHLASNSGGSVKLPGSLAYPLTYPDGTAILIAKTDANGKIAKDPSGNIIQVQALAVDKPRYLGPIISSTKGTPTRLKFLNLLPAGRIEFDANGKVVSRNGDIFFPVDKSVIGAGFGPDGLTEYTQNRANIHLHGGDTPWISDGTPHQWITPAAEADPTRVSAVNAEQPLSLAAEFAMDPARDPSLLPEFLRGASAQNVPDMNDPGAGGWTLYFPNGQTARMLWYHDHSVGATRLNVYAGIASAYMLSDATEQAMVTDGTLPPAERTIPLVLQDRTFVPDDISLQDAKWHTGAWGQPGDSWFPHVYETVQDPAQQDNTNAVGRWHYGPYFWPVFPALYPLPTGDYGDVTTTPEAWFDTPTVNGVAYPTIEVDPTTYRLRILNATNDRMMTVNLLVANSEVTLSDGTVVTSPLGDTEVDMVPATVALPEVACAAGQLRPSPVMVNGPDGLTPKLDARGKAVFCQPELWPVDNRIGGMPNPNSVGPALHQIASEGGWLPAVHSIEPNPLTYLLDKGRINVFNVDTPSLFMGPAERADVVVDFSQYAGKTLIIYNDSGAPIPAGDPRNDVFTGVGDQSGAGGAEDTKPGYGPNNRTVMQIKVKALPSGAAAPTPFETDGRLANLQAKVKAAFFQDQEKPVVAQPAYSGFNPAWEGLTQDQSYARIQTGSLKEPVFKFTPGEPSTSINSVKITERGTGYTSAPVVTINAPAVAGGRAATAAATLKINQLAVTSGGTGYTIAPTVSIVGGGGNGAVADAVMGVQAVTITAGGSGYATVAPTVTFGVPPVGGRRATGTAIVNAAGVVTGVDITDRGTGYVGTPTVAFSGGSGTGARGTTKGQVVEVHLKPADPQNPDSAGGGGFLNFDPNAAVNPFSINFVGGGGTGAAATASGMVFDITLDYAGRGYVAGEVPTVTVGAPAAGVTATAQSDLAAGGAAAGSHLVKTKAIHELFDATYGRLNSILGVELPFTSAMTQTTIPMSYLDAATETFSDGETQIWKITHNGVDSHPVHFHLLNVQLINRVDWAGIIMPPMPNELGWKETVKMNPLEDVIVAVRAKTPPLPGFGVPLSVRPMDPAQPLGSPFGFTQVDPITGTPKTVINEVMNYGWEYVWHCHILGHEENDFMRPIVFNAREGAPLAPVGLSATFDGSGQVNLSWVDPTPASVVSASSEVGFRVQRGPKGSGVFEDVPADLRSIVGLNGKVNTLANATQFLDANLPIAVTGATGAPTAPTAPTTNGIAFTSVTVNWTLPAAAPGDASVAGFQVQRADVDAAGVVGAYSTVNASPLASTTRSFIDGTVQPGNTYRYQVVAFGAGSVELDYRVASVNVVDEVFSAPVSVVVGNAEAVKASAPSNTAVTPMLAPSRQSLTVVGTGAGGAAPYNVTYGWTAVPGAQYVFRTRTGTTANNGVFTAWSAPSAALSATVTGVPAGRFVTVEVRAVSAANVQSATLSSGTMQLVVPQAPNGVNLSAVTADSLTLSWTARPNAVSYQVDVATNAAFTLGLVTTPVTSGTSFVATGLAPNTQYFFRVRSVNAIGTSGNSVGQNRYTLANAVTAVPTVIANTAGTAVGLSWEAPVGGAASYTIQRSADGGATWATLSANNLPTTYSATGLGVTNYQFRVLAANGNNVVALPSPMVAVTTPLAAPSAITAANGTAGGTVTAGLNFTRNNGGLATYEVRYRSIGAATWTGPFVVIPGAQVPVTGTRRIVEMQVRAVSASGGATTYNPAETGPVATGDWTGAPTVNVNAR